MMDSSDEEMVLISSCALVIAAASCKKKRKTGRLWMKRWLERRDEGRGVLSMLRLELAAEDPLSFANYCRMTPETFQDLLNLVRLDITKKNTRWREAISAEKRLAATLRFLATGETFRSLMYTTRIHESTIGMIVLETCASIYNRLKQRYVKIPDTVEEWNDVADDFLGRWGFPHCLGAVDGKHIRITPPPESGSYYYNYKGFHSIVLLAVVDSRYRFLYFDVGVNGRVSDGGVFAQSSLHAAIQNGTLNFPPNTSLPGVAGSVPFVFVGDDAFQLTARLMKPYPFRNLDMDQEKFNKGLCRARRVVENAFGILSNRFRIYFTTMNMSMVKIETVVAATVALHNYLITNGSEDCLIGGSPDEERPCDLPGLQVNQEGNRSSNVALSIRDQFKCYFRLLQDNQ